MRRRERWRRRRQRREPVEDRFDVLVRQLGHGLGRGPHFSHHGGRRFGLRRAVVTARDRGDAALRLSGAPPPLQRGAARLELNVALAQRLGRRAPRRRERLRACAADTAVADDDGSLLFDGLWAMVHTAAEYVRPLR